MKPQHSTSIGLLPSQNHGTSSGLLPSQNHGTSSGLLPSHDPAAGHGHNVSRCLCGGNVVWAFDDLYPEKSLGILVNSDPTPTGSLILWYEITGSGKPVGRQWFRELDPMHPYKGPRWQRHACTGVRP